MSDNKPTEDLTISDKPKIVLQVFLNSDGSFEMKSSLIPPMVNWMLDQIKFSLFMKSQEKSNIVPANGGLMNWVRGGFKK